MAVKENAFSIGQAAKLCQVSVQTLRFYDKIHLVKPADFDRMTGYRHYNNLNLFHIRIVQDLKSMGFSLEEIRRILQDNDLERLIEVMEEKRLETLQEMARLEKVSSSLAQRIGQMKHLLALGRNIAEPEILVELKELPERTVACDRRLSAIGLEPMALRFTEFLNKLGGHGLEPAGYPFTIFHEPIPTMDGSSADLEIGVPVASEPAGDLSFVRILPAGAHITAVYCGIPDHEACRLVHGKLADWMERNGYEEMGPAVEHYLVDQAQMMSPEDYIVELQIPVKKVLTL